MWQEAYHKYSLTQFDESALFTGDRKSTLPFFNRRITQVSPEKIQEQAVQLRELEDYGEPSNTTQDQNLNCLTFESISVKN